MIIELNGAWLLIQSGRTLVMTHAPKECMYCHGMTHFFENRYGETRCAACATQEEKAA